MTEPKFFVYVRSLDKPAAQLWYGDQTTGSGKFKYGEVGKWNSAASLVHFRELEGDDLAFSLKELEAKYPFEIGGPSDGFSYSVRRTKVSSPGRAPFRAATPGPAAIDPTVKATRERLARLAIANEGHAGASTDESPEGSD